MAVVVVVVKSFIIIVIIILRTMVVTVAFIPTIATAFTTITESVATTTKPAPVVFI